MNIIVANLLNSPAIDADLPVPAELTHLRYKILCARLQHGTAPCGERRVEEAIFCEWCRRITKDGVPGGCFACSRAGV